MPHVVNFLNYNYVKLYSHDINLSNPKSEKTHPIAEYYSRSQHNILLCVKPCSDHPEEEPKPAFVIDDNIMKKELL